MTGNWMTWQEIEIIIPIISVFIYLLKDLWISSFYIQLMKSDAVFINIHGTTNTSTTLNTGHGYRKCRLLSCSFDNCPKKCIDSSRLGVGLYSERNLNFAKESFCNERELLLSLLLLLDTNYSNFRVFLVKKKTIVFNIFYPN